MSVTSFTIVSNGLQPAVPNPGLEFSASEAGATYFEFREADGVLYWVQNATYNGTTWSLTTGSKAYAISQNPDGSLSYLTNPTTTPWTDWAGGTPRAIANVRDFGAKGDGTTDDTMAFQNAAASIPLQTTPGVPFGGVILVPPGIYRIQSMFLLPPNTELVGSGCENTTIKALANLNTNHTTIMVANTDYMNNTDPYTVSQTNFAIRGITFDGNSYEQVYIDKKTGATIPGPDSAIFFQSAGNVTIENCVVQNVNNNAISVTSTPTDKYPGYAIGNVRILNNTIDILPQRGSSGALEYGGFPIHLYSLQNVLIKGNIIGFNWNGATPTWSQDGIDTIACNQTIITDNLVLWTQDGIGTANAQYTFIANNFVGNTIGYPIRSSQLQGGMNPTNNGGTQIVISGNTILGLAKDLISTLFGPTPAGIEVAQATTGGSTNAPADITISSNVLYGPFAGDGIGLNCDGGSCTGNLIDLQGTLTEENSNGIKVAGNNWTVSGNTVINQYSGGGGGTAAIFITNVSYNSPVGPPNALVVIGNNAPSLAQSLTNGNATPFLAPNGLPTNSIISNNLGVNPIGVVGPPAIQPSTVMVPNPYPFNCTVYVKGGTATTVAVDNAPTGLGSGVGYSVAAGGSITLTYTTTPPPVVIPTWVWIAN